MSRSDETSKSPQKSILQETRSYEKHEHPEQK
jgi:hypothetical protein